MALKYSNLPVVGAAALLLAWCAAFYSAPAIAEDAKQPDKGRQILMVFTTNNEGELNPCG
jgi:hypothetical protein